MIWKLLAIMAIWLPCVFLGAVGAHVLTARLDRPDGVLLHLLSQYAPPILAGILGAGIISAVMGSDCHQVLALSTMFTRDIYSHYGGQEKAGHEAGSGSWGQTSRSAPTRRGQSPHTSSRTSSAT